MANRLVPSRFEIELTLLELDEWNEPVNEHAQRPITLYGSAAVHAWLELLPAMVAQAARQLIEGGDANGQHPEIRAPLPRTE